jgi:hypothetical protein
MESEKREGGGIGQTADEKEEPREIDEAKGEKRREEG